LLVFITPSSQEMESPVNSGRFKTSPVALLGNEENQRVQTHSVSPFSRFSYRYVATDLVEQATALLPERSQAYAAILCHATNWIINLDPARAQQLYRTYIQQGPYVTFGDAFGTGIGCEEPDFQRAQALQDRLLKAHLVKILKQLMPYGLSAVAWLAMPGFVWWRKRRNWA
jgi:hypothetical protein